MRRWLVSSPMPELPEVEATRRHLEPAVVGRAIAAVEVRRPRMVRYQPDPGSMSHRMVGRRIEAMGRHGKFLMAELEGDLTWVSHLGMSGRFELGVEGADEAPHTNVVVRLDDGIEVRLVDPRTFGFVAVFTPDELAESTLSRLGPDALDSLPPVTSLRTALTGRSAPIKALLLDQRLIAGIGNIYADEMLWRAEISPLRPGGSLLADEVAALRRAVRPVLTAGLRSGGTSLGDLAYLLPDGRAGEHMSRLEAYGRNGEVCRRCGTTMVRNVIRQRSSHWCPGCQK